MNLAMICPTGFVQSFCKTSGVDQALQDVGQSFRCRGDRAVHEDKRKVRKAEASNPSFNCVYSSSLTSAMPVLDVTLTTER